MRSCSTAAHIHGSFGADNLSLIGTFADEATEQLTAETYTPTAEMPKDKIPCYDPSTMHFLGYAKAMTPTEVGCPYCCTGDVLLHKLRRIQ